jgi:hypothetical protein
MIEEEKKHVDIRRKCTCEKEENEEEKERKANIKK